MIHFDNGSKCLLGLQICTDDEGQEFVQYGGGWIHVSEMPLPRLHTEEMSSQIVQPKRIPQIQGVPPSIEGLPEAFQPSQKIAFGKVGNLDAFT